MKSQLRWQEAEGLWVNTKTARRIETAVVVPLTLDGRFSEGTSSVMIN